MKREIILAIETAYSSGSISLLENSVEIDHWIGESESLRTENLLEVVAKLFSINSLQKSDIKKIIYSEGPGSHTGIRVGAATSKGLQTALECDCFGQSILKALTLQTDTEGLIQTAIQTTKKQVWRQIFEKKANNIIVIKSSAELVSEELFLIEINSFPTTIFLATNNEFVSEKQFVHVAPNSNIARLIGLTANYHFES